MKRDPDDDTDLSGWCEGCGEACQGTMIDEGIGCYEFWGSKGVDTNYVHVSECCHRPVLEHNPNCEDCGKHEVYDEDLCLACYNLKYDEAAA